MKRNFEPAPSRSLPCGYSHCAREGAQRSQTGPQEHFKSHKTQVSFGCASAARLQPAFEASPEITWRLAGRFSLFLRLVPADLTDRAHMGQEQTALTAAAP